MPKDGSSRKVILAVALSVAACFTTSAQGNRRVVDVRALVDDLDAKLMHDTAVNEFSGAVLIAKDGNVLWEKAYGDADREAHTPNTVDTRFRIGSLNKMFTAVAVAQLVEQRKLTFSDTLARVLPDYPNQAVASEITIDQLLTHTSGLRSVEFDQHVPQRKLEDYLPLFVNEPLEFQPGSMWSYSNSGYIVLGLVIERLSGEDYYAYIQRHIYDVAGMKSSGSTPTSDSAPLIAVGYIRDTPGGPLRRNSDTLPWRASPAGGGESTVGDLLRFDQALRSHKLLSAESTGILTTGTVHSERLPPGVTYGHGFTDLAKDGQHVIGKNGGAPGMNANLAMYWDSGFTVVVLANMGPPRADRWANYVQQYLLGTR